uniref:Uncharacterized protein n=1 Tax=Glossina palpalis gambiensis TaxID=67801 RepID=A0A1B0BP58_9MUSC
MWIVLYIGCTATVRNISSLKQGLFPKFYGNADAYGGNFATSTRHQQTISPKPGQACKGTSGTDLGGYSYSQRSNNDYFLPSTSAPAFRSPTSDYGPSSPSYGPPPPHYYKPVPFPSDPRDHYALLAKLKTKLNRFTIGKNVFKIAENESVKLFTMKSN